VTETTRARHFDEEIYGFGDADEFEQVLAMIEEDRRFVEKTGARTLTEVALVCDHVPWLIAQLRASRSAAPSEGPTESEPAAGFRNVLDVLRSHLREYADPGAKFDAEWIDEVLADNPPALPVPAQEAEALVAAFELSLIASDSFVGRDLFRREILAGLVDAARYRVLRDSLNHDRDEIGITFPAPRCGGGLVYSPAQLDAALDERLRASRSPEETPDAPSITGTPNG
jgi:hypothetical protein